MPEIKKLVLLMTIGLLWGCSGSGEPSCERACQNVSEVVAAAVGEKEVPPASEQEICVRTCLPQSPEYIKCLSDAKTMKALRECHGVSDS